MLIILPTHASNLPGNPFSRRPPRQLHAPFRSGLLSPLPAHHRLQPRLPFPEPSPSLCLSPRPLQQLSRPSRSSPDPQQLSQQNMPSFLRLQSLLSPSPLRHFSLLIKLKRRLLSPGRLLCLHCSPLLDTTTSTSPTMKAYVTH